jgi:polysaccharide export outer membrane protein
MQPLENQRQLYFDGFTVDDHGNIRFRIRRIKRNYYTLDEVRVRVEKQLLSEYFNKK